MVLNVPVSSRLRRALSALLIGVLATSVFIGGSFMAPAPVEASHTRSLELSWKRVTGTTVEFTSTFASRASYFGNPSVGSTINEFWVTYGDSGGFSPVYTVTTVNAINDYFIATAIWTHTYAGDGPYVAVAETCCRLGYPLHINNPDGNHRAETLVNLAVNDASPTSSISPIVDCPVDAPCAFFVPAVAPGGQTLQFRLATSGESGLTYQPGPPHAATAASIDAATGLYSWDTTGATVNPDGDTYYSTQVIIESVVDQVVTSRSAVDFFIRISGDSTNQAPAFINQTPADGATFDAVVGALFECSVAAQDPDETDVVTLGILGKPGDATYTIVDGNPATGLFAWTPAETGSVILTLSAQDQLGLQATQRSITIIVAEEGAVEEPRLCGDATPTPTPTPTATPSITLPPTSAIGTPGAGTGVDTGSLVGSLLAAAAVMLLATIGAATRTRRRI